MPIYPFGFGGGQGGEGGAATALVQIPAIALFEHPEDATTLFDAAGGAEGLTVTIREPLEYGQDTSQWRIVGAQRYQGVAAVAAVAASVQIPTSATGGIAVTFARAGADANSHYIDARVGNNTVVTHAAGSDLYSLVVGDGATAANALAALNAHADLTAAYYGTEAGATVVRVGNGPILAGFAGRHDFTGGIDAADEIPADPVHVVVDSTNMRITAYYNLAAGGVLTEADTLGDLKGAFDTAAEGLSSEYVGGGDMDTVMTRAFATESQFSQANLRGLRLALTDPVAAGARGNSFGLVARERFAGGAEVAERQAHILIYTNTGPGAAGFASRLTLTYKV